MLGSFKYPPLVHPQDYMANRVKYIDCPLLDLFTKCMESTSAALQFIQFVGKSMPPDSLFSKVLCWSGDLLMMGRLWKSVEV